MYQPRSANPDGSGPCLLSAVLTGNVHLAGILVVIDVVTAKYVGMNRKESRRADEPVSAVAVFKHIHPDRPYLDNKVM